MNCAAYWRRCLDEMVEMTAELTQARSEDLESSTSSETGKKYLIIVTFNKFNKLMATLQNYFKLLNDFKVYFRNLIWMQLR